MLLKYWIFFLLHVSGIDVTIDYYTSASEFLVILVITVGALAEGIGYIYQDVF